MALTGPADADAFRVVKEYGRRYYVDPLPADDVASADEGEYPSVSAVKKASGSDWSFVTRRRIAEALVADPERFTRLKTVKEVQDALLSADKADLEKAAGRGTFVHSVCEDLLYGREPYTAMAPAEGLVYLDAIQAFFDTYKPELVAAETVAFHRDLHGVGYAGTADAFLRIGGRTVIADFKSRGPDSKHSAYPEEAAQIAAYASAQYLVVEGDDGAKRIPVPELDGGLIISIKPDGVRLYPIDLEPATAHWTALHRWYVARKDERKAIGRQLAQKKAPARKVEPPVSVDIRIELADTAEELYDIYNTWKSQWTPELTQLAAQRKAELAGK